MSGGDHVSEREAFKKELDEGREKLYADMGIEGDGFDKKKQS